MFTQTTLPEPYPDEALSSWMYRVRETLPEPEIRALRGLNDHDRSLSPFATPYVKLVGGRGKDLDFDFEQAEIHEFAKAYDLPVEWIKSVFSPTSGQIVPIWFRSDYCLRCMEESIGDVGFPVYLKSWRLILKPFCQKHGCVLRSADNYLNDSIDFAMNIFEYDSDRPDELQRQAKWLEKDADVQELGRMVADRVGTILDQAQDKVVRENVENFVMTLLRITLMPSCWSNYSSIIKFRVQSSEEFESKNELALFYQYPLRVTAMARARSFYLMGLLLGWIDAGQAENVRPRDDFYLATSASSIWRRLGSLHRLRPILQLYSTELLGISTLTDWGRFNV